MTRRIHAWQFLMTACRSHRAQNAVQVYTTSMRLKILRRPPTHVQLDRQRQDRRAARTLWQRVNAVGVFAFTTKYVKEKCTYKDRQQGFRPLQHYQEIYDNIENHTHADCLRYQG
jgi:hypothetical protein